MHAPANASSSGVTPATQGRPSRIRPPTARERYTYARKNRFIWRDTMTINRMTIIGRGAIGLLYGSIAAATLGSDAVEYVMDAERFARHEGEQIRVLDQPCNLPTVRVKDAKPAELLVLAVKAGGLDAALDLAAPLVGPGTRIVSLLNGITSEGACAARFGWEGVVPAVAQGLDATYLEHNLRYSSAGHIHIGAGDKTSPAAVADVADFFGRAGIPHIVEDDIRHRLWAKLMLNVGVNQTTMAFGGTYGTVASDPEQIRCFVAAMREVRAVAAAEGVELTEAELTDMFELCAQMAPDGMPSMAQDRVMHRPTEVEEFSGTIVRLGREHGILTPQNEWLYQRIREIEASW